MHLGVRATAAGAAALVAAGLLSSCGSSPTAEQKNAVRSILTTTTTAAATSSNSSTSTSSTTTRPGVTVPNVIGLKIAAAHSALRAAGLPTVGLNAACTKGTLASQSVVSSLAIPGKAPDVSVGAVPLSPGAVVPSGTRVGITWSGCYADASTVPAVVGLTFSAARHALHGAGLTWACYSVGKTATTTTTKAHPTTSDSSTSSTTAPVTTTTARAPQTVLVQTPAAGTVLRPGATVSLTMHVCPQ